MKRSLVTEYTHYASVEEMSETLRMVVEQAQQATKSAYAPYSNFCVGAAALLESGKIITASNQESEVYPSGICAERNLLYNHSATAPDDKIVVMAIASDPAPRECYPCGMCRQVLVDTEKRQGSPMRVVMCGSESASEVASAKLLMPFTFEL